MERQGLRTLRPSGFEPLTYRLEGGCSIQLSYGRFCVGNFIRILNLSEPPEQSLLQYLGRLRFLHR